MAGTLDLGALGASLEVKDKFSEGFGKFSEACNEAELSFGSFANVVAAGVAASAAVIAGLTAAIVELGERGSVVNDVAEDFDKLNANIGNSANVLGTLRNSMNGTVSDFNIMKSTNEALSKGLVLNADQMGMVGEAARTLARRVGGDTAEAYDKLMNALATGRPRMLQQMNLQVDSATAVLKYADSIGVSTGALTKQQELLAVRQAMLEKMSAAVDVSGKKETDFKERLEQVQVGVSNFVDALSSAVAKSPVVNAAMDAISSALKNAFGTNQATAVKTLMSYVNSFVIFLVQAGEVGIDIAKNLVYAWDLFKLTIFVLEGAVSLFVASTSTGLSTVLDYAAKAAAGLAAAMAYIPTQGAAAQGLALVADGLKAMGVAATGTAESAKKMAQSFGEQAHEVLDSAVKQTVVFDGMKKGLTDLEAGLKKAATASDVVTSSTKSLTTATTEATSESLQLLNARNALRGEMEKMLPLLQGALNANMPIEQISQQFGAGIEKIIASAKELKIAVDPIFTSTAADIKAFKISEMLSKDLPELQKVGDEFGEKLRQMVLTGTAKEMDAMESERTQAIAELQKKYDAMKAQAEKERITLPPAVTDEFKKSLDAIKAYFDKLEFGLSFSQSLQAAFANLPQTIMSAIQGGGGIQAVTKSVGQLFGSTIFSKDSALTKTTTSGLSSVLGSTLGSALGIVIPGLGGILGSAVGSLLGSIFGPSQAKQTDELRQKFLASAGGLDVLKQKADAAGVSLTTLLSTKKVDTFNAAMKQVQDDLNETDQANQDLDDAIKKYGLSIDQLGPKFANQRLQAQAQDLYKSFELLTGAGADVGVVIQKMGPDLVAFAQTAMKTGQAIPLAMKPMIDALIKSGQLVDANGKAFGSAQDAGITFSQTLDDEFKSVLDSIQALVDALNGIHNHPVTVPVQVQYTYGTYQGPVAPTGPVIQNPTANKPPGYATGSDGFQNFGMGRLAMLHGLEAVVTKTQWDSMLGAVGNVSSGSASSGTVTVPRAAVNAAKQTAAVPIIHLHNYIGGKSIDKTIIQRQRAGFIPKGGK